MTLTLKSCRQSIWHPQNSETQPLHLHSMTFLPHASGIRCSTRHRCLSGLLGPTGSIPVPKLDTYTSYKWFYIIKQTIPAYLRYLDLVCLFYVDPILLTDLTKIQYILGIYRDCLTQNLRVAAIEKKPAKFLTKMLGQR